MENASEEMHSNKTSLSISGEERELDLLSVCPPTHLKMFKQKRNTQLLRSNHPYYRNVAKHLWREPQIIKFENDFPIWINIVHLEFSLQSAKQSLASETACNYNEKLQSSYKHRCYDHTAVFSSLSFLLCLFC